MTELLKIDNFKGMVTDVSDGKQPQGTCKEIKNMVYDREYGSLVTRYTYENSIARPSGVSTLSEWLSFPVTYPTPTDHHLWFTEDGIYQYNYWHNSSTLTNGWVLVTDKLFSTLPPSLAHMTINGSPTNTIVITNATTQYGFSDVTNYYKNWVLALTDGSQNSIAYLVIAYSVSGSTATITLDNIIDTSTGVTYDENDIVEMGLYRYFHQGKTADTVQSSYFTPAFSYPAGYSTETAFRWSGGANSSVGYVNCKSGYINKIFFNNSGKSHTFTGTYIDQAECYAPPDSLLKTSSFITADANSNVITASKNYDFNNVSSTDWSASGKLSVAVGTFSDKQFGGRDGGGLSAPVTGLLLTSDGTNGDFSVAGTNNASLTDAYTTNLTNATPATIKIKARTVSDGGVEYGTLSVRVTQNSVTYDAKFILDNTEKEYSYSFTPTGTDDPSIMMCLQDVEGGASRFVIITAISISQTSLVGVALENNKTYKLWASYVYDKTQESELTYLASSYVTGKYSKLQYELNQKLGSLNKFVSGIRLYMSREDGDTTLETVTPVAPRYLMTTIWVDDDSTSTWTFDTTQGQYEYASSFNGADWNNRSVTWEQKTQRTVSSSTTCSYYLAKMASGRVFLADDYDYSDRRMYINRVRYTGFNGDGNPTPDIFPNINDVFITTITAGRSQEIRNIAEFDGDLIILKKNSILRLDTSNPDPFTWNLQLIKDGVGSRSARGAYKFDKGLFFTDLYSAYLYDGYQVRDVLKGRWRNAYQLMVTSDAIATSQLVWYNPVNDTISIAFDTTSDTTARNYYEFNTDSWLPVYQQNGSGYELQNLTVTSDGVIHFAPTSVGANSSKFSTTAQANLVNAVVDTGYYGMPVGKLAEPKWVYVLAQLPNTSEMTVTLYGDNATTIGQGIFTSASNEIRLYKFQTISDMPNRMLKVYIVQNGTVAPSTKELKVMNILVEGNVVDEFTDITETVTVT